MIPDGFQNPSKKNHQKGTSPRFAEAVLLLQGMFLSQPPLEGVCQGDAMAAPMGTLIPDPSPNQQQQSRAQRCARNSWGGTQGGIPSLALPKGHPSPCFSAVRSCLPLLHPPHTLLPWPCFPWNSLVPWEGSGLAGFAHLDPRSKRRDIGLITAGSIINFPYFGTRSREQTHP